MQPPQTCLVCRTPLSPHDAPTAPLCRSLSCRWKYSATPKEWTCRVCGRLLSIEELPGRVCADSACRERWAIEQARLLRQRREEEARALRQQGADRLGIARPDRFRLTFIPSYDAVLDKLSRRRRRAFRAHLKRLISEAGARRVEPEPMLAPRASRADRKTVRKSEVAAVLAGACASCKGFCCATGGDHAYLTVDTIRRYLQAHPDQGPDQVLAAYWKYLGAETCRGSCVYHGLTGCALPRAMRSDTCNRYFCEGLRDFQEGLPKAGPVCGFFYSTDKGRVFSGAFVDARSRRVVEKQDG